jgi:hypothetical protein
VTVSDMQRLVAGAVEVADDHTGNRPVVVNDQHTRHIRSLGSRSESRPALPHFVRPVQRDERSREEPAPGAPEALALGRGFRPRGRGLRDIWRGQDSDERSREERAGRDAARGRRPRRGSRCAPLGGAAENLIRRI